MMTQAQYENFWNVYVAPLDTQMLMPSYYAYLQREVYFQDYFDLFIKSRVNDITFPRKIIDGVLTVELPITVNSDNDHQTRIDENGVVRLVVEHDFRFSEESFIKQTAIKYVLIGEAAPSSGKYIYKDASGAYITAPLEAANVNDSRMNKTERLEQFAAAGYLLLDLFPFSFDFNRYNKLRKKLTTQMTLMDKAVKDVEIKINKLTNLTEDWKFCFVAPETTSMAIINFLYLRVYPSLAGKAIWHSYDLLNSNNFIITKKNGNLVEYLNYTAHTNPQGSPLSHLSKHARLTTIIGGNGPHHELVFRALF
jgi:hypothetical protein